MNLFKKLFQIEKIKNDLIEVPEPDGSIEYFRTIKRLSESFFEESSINPRVSGFQIQQGSKWKDGLTDDTISEFERALNTKFPNELKNFYRTMNGLNKNGINVFGSDKYEPAYSPVFYSYPDNLVEIKQKIKWAMDSNGLTEQIMKEKNIPMIVPIMAHRFMVIDQSNPIFSIYGDDIVCWSETLSKFIGQEIFDGILYNPWDFENPPNCFPKIRFWNEN